MNMLQCKNGHFYDADKHSTCPFCTSAMDVGVTRPLGNQPQNANINAPEFPKTAPLYGNPAPMGDPMDPAPAMNFAIPDPMQSFPKTQPLNNPYTNVTVALDKNEKGIAPIRGWLICIEGNKKGKDFGIRSEKNTVGRGKENSICLDFDESISREPEIIITYDQRKNNFWIQPGTRGNVYINEDILLTPIQLNAYDIISIGKSKLLFMPLCSEKFNWD